MGLVVLVPTLGRPHRLKALAQMFRETSPKHRLLFIVDPSDHESKAAGGSVGDVLIAERTGYPAKINHGIRATTESTILLAADDVKPHEGWYEVASQMLSDTVGMVSLNDLGNKQVMRGRLATFPLIARWYVEKYGVLLHEGYQHNCCDVEMSELAQKRGAFAYAPRAVMEHMHVLWGKADEDKTYRDWALNETMMQEDRALLRERRLAWSQ